MDFAAMRERALAVREKYAAHERDRYGREWSLEELALGLVSDVGDLARLIQAFEGVRDTEHVESALEHELADALWSLIVIADRCGVDLQRAFSRTMDEIDTALTTREHEP